MPAFRYGSLVRMAARLLKPKSLVPVALAAFIFITNCEALEGIGITSLPASEARFTAIAQALQEAVTNLEMPYGKA